jgi:c-di-AMP phosphodiesterase-like protein
VAEILEQSLALGDLSKEEAELLLAGIFLDTKNFSRNTGTRTFSAALYLRGEGANPSDAEGMISKTTLEEFIKQARFEANISIYRNSAAISVFEPEASFTDRNADAKAAERMLEIEGVAAAFVIYRIEGVAYISARSLPWGNINVQILMEALGGGGHFEFAGAQLKNLSLADASVLVKKTIDDYFDAK